MVRLVALGALFTLTLSSALAQPLTLGGDPRVDPDDFRVTTFASGLNFPYGMAELTDGSLLVGTSDPTGGGYSQSTGRLLRLVDLDADGVADGAPQTLYNGLPGQVTAVRTAGDLILATSVKRGDETISVLRSGATPSDPLSLVGTIDFTITQPWKHSTYALAVQPSALPNQYDVYFNLGSKANEFATTVTVPVSGLLTANLAADAIHRVTLTDHGSSVSVGGLTQIATGLRNAAGIAFDPLNGDLYFEDNGIDGLVDPTEPLSVDELNRLPAADIGGAIEDYGFGHDYIEYRTGNRIGSGAIQPVAAFQPLPDPMTGSESEGPAEIAFSPEAFPAGLNRGVFVGFHGQAVTGGLANEENPLVYVDLDTGEYFHFIGNDQPNVGHLDGLLATSDSLFVADMGASGGLGVGGDGAIYQILALPPPLPGDANRDGQVSGADYTIWADNFGLWDGDARWRHGDFNDDGYVTGGDYTIWADNFGGGEVTLEPEPQALLLIAIGGALALAATCMRLQLKALTGHATCPVHFTVLPGDANGDNQVTGADYSLWADNFGQPTATFEQGDFTGDGQLTPADYTIWADNFGIDLMGAATTPARSEWPNGNAAPLLVDAVLLSPGAVGAKSVPRLAPRSAVAFARKAQRVTYQTALDARQFRATGLRPDRPRSPQQPRSQRSGAQSRTVPQYQSLAPQVVELRPATGSRSLGSPRNSASALGPQPGPTTSPGPRRCRLRSSAVVLSDVGRCDTYRRATASDPRTVGPRLVAIKDREGGRMRASDRQQCSGCSPAIVRRSRV